MSAKISYEDQRLNKAGPKFKHEPLNKEKSWPWECKRFVKSSVALNMIKRLVLRPFEVMDFVMLRVWHGMAFRAAIYITESMQCERCSWVFCDFSCGYHGALGFTVAGSWWTVVVVMWCFIRPGFLDFSTDSAPVEKSAHWIHRVFVLELEQLSQPWLGCDWRRPDIIC